MRAPVPASTIQGAIKAAAEGLTSTAHANTRWAERILEREAAGLHTYPIARQFAREALNLPANYSVTSREPGSDDA